MICLISQTEYGSYWAEIYKNPKWLMTPYVWETNDDTAIVVDSRESYPNGYKVFLEKDKRVIEAIYCTEVYLGMGVLNDNYESKQPARRINKGCFWRSDEGSKSRKNVGNGSDKSTIDTALKA